MTERTKRQPTSPNEIRALLGLVERDLGQAETPGLLLDGRYAFLYNAALQLATIVLRLNDVRIGQISHHRETFRAVGQFVPLDLRSEIDLFEHARRKRNALTYDQVGAVSDVEVTTLQESIGVFEKWVRKLADDYLAKRAEGG